MKSMKDRLALMLASGFGLGMIVPFAPGTFGSLPGFLLAFGTTLLSVWIQIPLCLVFVFIAIVVCDRAEKLLGVKDDGRITADEWLLYPIAVMGIPLCELPFFASLVFFVVVRLIDIIKPPPARELQSIRGGAGIVVDDFVANLYALGINLLVYRLVFA